MSHETNFGISKLYEKYVAKKEYSFDKAEFITARNDFSITLNADDRVFRDAHDAALNAYVAHFTATHSDRLLSSKAAIINPE